MNHHPLAPHASPDSVERYDVARDLAERYPPVPGAEIALSGSAARGWADADSDIEFVCWLPRAPSQDEHRAWLAAVGATDIAPQPHISLDGTVWEWSRYRGFWLETGSQDIARHQHALAEIAAGRVTDHRLLTLADTVADAVPLRTEGLLAQWQRTLAVYPDALRAELVRSGARRWSYAIAYWALARRGDRVAVAERLLADVQSILRIVYAFNGVWEPAWKWNERRTAALAVQPPHLQRRIDEILALTDLERSCEACALLFADTLAHVPPQIDVAPQLAMIRASLRDRAP